MSRLSGQSNRCASISANGNGDLLVVTMKGIDGEECAEWIDGGSAENWQGAKDVYGFNASYLAALCRLYRHAERISIVAPDTGSPAIVGPEETKSLTALMPMRVDADNLIRSALLAFTIGANDKSSREAAA